MPTRSMCFAVRSACCVLALLMGLSGGAPVVASGQTATSEAVKAAFLFNFSKFIEWPRDPALSAESPFVVGVLGEGGVTEALREIVRGKSVGRRALKVQSVTMKDDLATLQMLFISAAEAGRIAQVLKQIGQARVLTVSDANRFCQLGGMIEFRAEDDRVRFDINLNNSEPAGLVISSKLLALARIVHTTKSR